MDLGISSSVWAGLAALFAGSCLLWVLSTGPSSISTCLRMFKRVPRPDRTTPLDIIAMVISYAELAARKGLPSLKNRLQSIDNEFFCRAIRLVLKGIDPEMIRGTLHLKMSFIENRHKENRFLLKELELVLLLIGFFVFSILAIDVILRDPGMVSVTSELAAAAIVPLTAFGMVFLVIRPVRIRLRVRSENELRLKVIMVEGIMSILGGSPPLLLEQRLTAFLGDFELPPIPTENTFVENTCEDNIVDLDHGPLDKPESDILNVENPGETPEQNTGWRSQNPLNKE